MNFHGHLLNVIQSLDVLKDTSKVVFNSSKLALGHATFSSAALKEELIVPASEFSVDEASERVTVQLPTTLAAGTQLALRIDFGGELTGSML